MPGALDDIVVIELTTELWSRLAGALLGDFGARVVRIDDPGCDPSPVGIYEPRTPATWRALADLADRNKRSVAVHLGTVDGCALAARLVRKADVVLTDWPVDRLVTAGLDADARRGADPRLVYARGSGFGPKGVDRVRPPIDELAAARAGMVPLLAQPGQPPLFPGHGMMYTAVMLAVGVLLALRHRSVAGEGQVVDASLLAGNVYAASLDLQAFLAMGGERFLRPVDRLDAGNPMSGVMYRSADDRWITMTMPDTDTYWPSLASVTGLDAADPRFDTHERRCGAHRLELIAALEEAIGTRPAVHWRTTFEEHGLSADVVETYDYPVADPVARRNRYLLDLPPGPDAPHGADGARSMVGFPVHLEATPADLRRPAPAPGEHTAEVLAELLGMGDDEIATITGAPAPAR